MYLYNLNFIFVTINLKKFGIISSIEKNKNITLIINGILEKKGHDIVVIDFKNNSNAPCSFFIICSARSKIRINSIANNIEKILLNKLKVKNWRDEGRGSNWRLIDYGDIVIHVFKEETREYYKLEELWGDALIKKI